MTAENTFLDPSTFCENYDTALSDAPWKTNHHLYDGLLKLFHTKEHPALKDYLVYGSAELYLLTRRAETVLVSKLYNLIEIFYFKKEIVSLKEFFKQNDLNIIPGHKCFLLSQNKNQLSRPAWIQLFNKEQAVLQSFSTYSAILAQVYLTEYECISKNSATNEFEILDVTCAGLEYKAIAEILLPASNHGHLLRDMFELSQNSITALSPSLQKHAARLVDKVYESAILLLPGTQKQLTFKNFSIWQESGSNSIIISQENRKYKVTRTATFNNTYYDIHLCSKKFAGAFAPIATKSVSVEKFNSLILTVDLQELKYTSGYLQELMDVLTQCLLNMHH